MGLHNAAGMGGAGGQARGEATGCLQGGHKGHAEGGTIAGGGGRNGGDRGLQVVGSPSRLGITVRPQGPVLGEPQASPGEGGTGGEHRGGLLQPGGQTAS